MRLPALHGRLPTSGLVPDSSRGPERWRAARRLPPHTQRKGQESSSSSSALLPPSSFPLSVSLRMSKNHPVVLCPQPAIHHIPGQEVSESYVWWIYLTFPAFVHHHPLKSNMFVPVSPAGRHHDGHQRSRRGNTDGNKSFLVFFYDCFIPS